MLRVILALLVVSVVSASDYGHTLGKEQAAQNQRYISLHEEGNEVEKIPHGGTGNIETGIRLRRGTYGGSDIISANIGSSSFEDRSFEPSSPKGGSLFGIRVGVGSYDADVGRNVRTRNSKSREVSLERGSIEKNGLGRVLFGQDSREGRRLRGNSRLGSNSNEDSSEGIRLARVLFGSVESRRISGRGGSSSDERSSEAERLSRVLFGRGLSRGRDFRGIGRYSSSEESSSEETRLPRVLLLRVGGGSFERGSSRDSSSKERRYNIERLVGGRVGGDTSEEQSIEIGSFEGNRRHRGGIRQLEVEVDFHTRPYHRNVIRQGSYSGYQSQGRYY